MKGICFDSLNKVKSEVFLLILFPTVLCYRKRCLEVLSARKAFLEGLALRDFKSRSSRCCGWLK